MNTWNVSSASCDAPEDKAEGLQDIDDKVSYRNLIFGNNGRKAHRPVSERARAAESLFADEEGAAVLYAQSSAFVSRKQGNVIVVPEEEGMTVLEVMEHSQLWKQLREIALNELPAPKALVDEGRKTSRCMKIAKPWKRSKKQ